MATDRATLSAAIVTRLKDASSLHNNVLDYRPGEFNHYPTAVVVSTGHDVLPGDNGRDIRLYKFDVQVYVDRSRDTFGTEKGERIRRELEDEIMAIFDQHQDLSGACNWLVVDHGGWGWAEDPGIAYFTLNFTCYKEVNVSSS